MKKFNFLSFVAFGIALNGFAVLAVASVLLVIKLYKEHVNDYSYDLSAEELEELMNDELEEAEVDNPYSGFMETFENTEIIFERKGQLNMDEYDDTIIDTKDSEGRLEAYMLLMGPGETINDVKTLIQEENLFDRYSYNISDAEIRHKEFTLKFTGNTNATHWERKVTFKLENNISWTLERDEGTVWDGDKEILNQVKTRNDFGRVNVEEMDYFGDQSNYFRPAIIGRNKKIVRVKTLYDFLEQVDSYVTLILPDQAIRIDEIILNMEDLDMEGLDSLEEKIKNVNPKVSFYMYREPDKYVISDITISDCQNLVITGSYNKTKLVTEDETSRILVFENCRDICLSGIFMKHTVPGYCSGDVLVMNSVKNADIEYCILDGSGMIGLNCEESNNIYMYQGNITNCRETAVDISNSSNIRFDRVEIHNNCKEERNHCVLWFANTKASIFSKCNIYNNRAEMILDEEDSEVELFDCAVHDNEILRDESEGDYEGEEYGEDYEEGDYEEYEN